MKLVSRAVLGLAVVVGVALAFAPPAGAQVTTGSLAGLVTDETGDTALPGAVVSAVHQPTGTRYSSVTNASGRFSFQGVRPGGPYAVTVEMDGFEPGEANNVFVVLGETTNLTFGLQLAGITEVLTVVSESSPLINPGKTGAASSVTQASIENLPTVGRGLEDFARLNPFFVVQSDGEDPDNISIAGRNARYNNIQIDGAVNNDLFGLADQGTPGGQTNTTPISLDAIQEVQLVLADFDVRQGGFSSGSVNAITRSGTNTFHGSAYYFTRDDGNFGNGPRELGELGDFEEDNYGFRLGGPISRDRAFFFVNYDVTDTTQPTGWSLDGTAGQTWANGEGADEAAAFRQLLIDRYGFDPGGLSQNARETPSDKIFGRIDVNLNEQHQLTLRHNFVDAQNDINRPSSFTYEWPSETYQITNETNSTVLQLNSVFGADKFNEFRITNQTIKDRRGGRDVTFPWIEIENVIDDQTGADLGEWEMGTEQFSTRNALDQDILEITNDFTWLKGNHTITIGTHNELFSFDNLFIQNAFGAYEFTNQQAFEDGIARRFRFTQVVPGQPDTQKFDVNQIGVYFGDEWAYKPNVTLTYGLRVDVPFFPDKPSRNPFTEATYGFRTDEIPDGNELIQPRFGFNWDLAGDGTQQLRGGTGIFGGRAPYVWISNNYARTGLEQVFIEQRNVPFNPDPFGQTIDPDAPTAIGEFNLIDPDFEFPQVWRTNIAYDRQLPWWGLIGTVELVYGDSIEEIDYKNLNIRRSGAVLPFDNRPLFEEVDPGVDGAYLIGNTSIGEATNFAIKLEKPYGDGVWGHVSYTYGQSEVANDGSSSRAVSNWQFTEAIDPNNVGPSTSDFEVEHRFNASASYQADWGGSGWTTTFSAFYNLQSGRPYGSLVGDAAFPFNSINEDGFGFNDLMYVPANEDDVILTRGTWEQLDAYINSDDCLRSNRGGIAPRNCAVAPWFHQLDIRIAQDIPLGGSGRRFQLTFDLLNAVNVFDRDSGVLRYVRFGTATPLEWVGFDEATGKPIFEVQRIVSDPENNSRYEIHNIRSRWRAKLGARFTF